MTTEQVSRRILWTVLFLNLGMGCVELVGSVAANSSALMADAMDFLADAFTYGVTLYVLTHAARVKRAAAIGKALLMAGLGIFVLAAAIWRYTEGSMPEAPLMGGLAALAFTVNLAAAAMLYRYRSGDSNLRSAWLCSRNDVVINLLVLAAAGLVFATASPWPDLVVAVLIVLLEFHSAGSILRQVRREKREDYSTVIACGHCESDTDHS